MTRAQLATMVWRFAANYLGVDVWSVDPSALSRWPDHDAIYPFAVDAMIWCADRGLITGNIDPWGQPWLESESIAKPRPRPPKSSPCWCATSRGSARPSRQVWLAAISGLGLGLDCQRPVSKYALGFAASCENKGVP